MNRVEALAQLSETSQQARLTAARVLLSVSLAEDAPALRAALASEKIPWIRSALEAALARSIALPTGVEREELEDDLVADDVLASDIYARATQELTERFVHEFRPLLGLTRVHAQQEIEHYDTSQTAELLRRMQSLLHGIDTLGKASATAKLRHFDLSEAIREATAWCYEELSASDLPFLVPSLDGPDAVEVYSDPDLLSLAIRNGIKNALEASIDTEDRVVVSWNQSNTEFWISVLDFGAGLSTDSRILFDLGTSSKSKHFGAGLAIVERVVATLNGEVRLESLEDGSTRFEIHVPRADQT